MPSGFKPGDRRGRQKGVKKRETKSASPNAGTPDSPAKQVCGMGRPSKFMPEFTPHIEMMCRLGATDEEIAYACGVSRQTFHSWRTEHPDFLDTVKRAKAEADREVVASLYKRARGYTQKVTKAFQFQGTVVTAVVEEHVAADTTAAIFWLKNRDPQGWRDRQGNINLNAHADNADELSELLEAIDGKSRPQTGQPTAGDDEVDAAESMPAKPVQH